MFKFNHPWPVPPPIPYALDPNPLAHAPNRVRSVASQLSWADDLARTGAWLSNWYSGKQNIRFSAILFMGPGILRNSQDNTPDLRGTAQLIAA